MSKIPKHHFNKDMDDYIKARKGTKPIWQIKFKVGGKKKRHKAEPAMEIPEHEIKNVLEKKPVQDKSVLEVPEVEKPGFFESVLGSLFGRKDDYDDAGEPVKEEAPKANEGELSPEVVEVLKIAGKWISKLPKDLKEEFRDSPDYAKYKFYLEKWGLTKKK